MGVPRQSNTLFLITTPDPGSRIGPRMASHTQGGDVGCSIEKSLVQSTHNRTQSATQSSPCPMTLPFPCKHSLLARFATSTERSTHAHIHATKHEEEGTPRITCVQTEGIKRRKHTRKGLRHNQRKQRQGKVIDTAPEHGQDNTEQDLWLGLLKLKVRRRTAG